MIALNWIGSIWGRLPDADRLRAALDLAMEWIERSAQRRALSRVDYRIMTDLGLNRAKIEAECAKPFWKK